MDLFHSQLIKSLIFFIQKSHYSIMKKYLCILIITVILPSCSSSDNNSVSEKKWNISHETEETEEELSLFVEDNNSVSVNENKENKDDAEDLIIEEENSELKRGYYLSKMRKKDFSLIINGPCDDAIEDTLHESYIGYVDSSFVTDNNATFYFKIKAACCQEFLGDYNVKNDTLKFEFEQVNNEVCSCLCWYKYKLSINNIDQKFKTIQISPKK